MGDLYEYQVSGVDGVFNMVADEITQANEMCLMLTFEGRVIYMTTEPFTIRCIGKWKE